MLAPRGIVSGQRDLNSCLVVVFLRGGADGLHMVAPTQDDHYRRARLTLGLDRSSALPLDDRFALHRRLEPLLSIFREGELAVVHAAGSEDGSRSHFEAQDFMEHGGAVAGGWLGRFLRFKSGAPGTGTDAETGISRALSAVALGKTLPESLRGAPSATVFQSIDDFSLGDQSKPLLEDLQRLYATEQGELGGAARDTLRALHRIEDLRGEPYRPAGGADYPAGEFGDGLQQIAQLIKARVGLEAVALDLDGWDSHIGATALMEPLMFRLAAGLAAFRRDLGELFAHTSVVVMTEFGRRVAENASLGTDHGRGSVMLVLGGGVQGGRIAGDWPGLDPEVLEGPGDVPVANNYRDVLAPVLIRHGASDLSRVFPAHALNPIDL